MSFELLVTSHRRGFEPPLRVCLDANVWVSYLAAASAMRRGLPAKLVDLIDAGHAHGISLQLFVSLELLDTIHVVLTRLGYEAPLVGGFIAALEGLMRTGPEALAPPLFLAGRDQLPMHDREDAGVLAACFASDVELLITDNLVDFDTPDSERLDTQIITRADGSERQLFALIHEPIGRAVLVVMHPHDALELLRNGQRPTAEEVRAIYAVEDE